MAQKALAGETIDITPENVTELEDDNDADLSAIFASFGGAPDDKTYYMRIYRVHKDTAEMAWLFNCVPSELPIDNRLRDEYKGGRFEIRIYEMRGGKFTLKKRPHILIEAPQKSEQTTRSDLADVLKGMQEQNRQLFEQMTTVLKTEKGVNDPVNPAGQVSMLRELAGLMRDMLPPPGPPQNSLKDTIETLAMLKDLIPDRSGDTNFMDIVGKVIESPLLGGLMQALPKPGVMPALAAPPGTVQQPAPPKQENPEMSFMQQQIARYISDLLAHAKAGTDPDAAADMIAESISPAMIKAHLLAPNAIDEAAKVNPAVNEYRAWFDKVQASLKELFTPGP